MALPPTENTHAGVGTDLGLPNVCACAPVFVMYCPLATAPPGIKLRELANEAGSPKAYLEQPS